MRTPKDRILAALEARIGGEYDNAYRLRLIMRGKDLTLQYGASGRTNGSVLEAAERALKEAREDLEYAKENLK